MLDEQNNVVQCSSPDSKFNIITVAKHTSIYFQRGSKRDDDARVKVELSDNVSPEGSKSFFPMLIQTSVNLNTAFSKPKDHGIPGYMCLCEITGFATELRQSCHHGLPL